MRCPICRIDMIKEKFGDVRVGLCKNGCHGIWITYKDLIRIAKKNEGFGASFNEALNTPGTGKSGRGQILCPECQIPMHVHKYRSTINIVVDECYKCGGFFLDPGELKGITLMERKQNREGLIIKTNQTFLTVLLTRFISTVIMSYKCSFFSPFCLPFGKAGDTPSPSLLRARSRLLRLRP